MSDKPVTKEYMTMMDGIEKVILDQAKEGRVVFVAIDQLESILLDEFIKQPTDGLLYDLNRSPEVILTRKYKDPKWINDYAVYLVIKRLKEFYDAHHADELGRLAKAGAEAGA
jgi:hypothetical protein